MKTIITNLLLTWVLLFTSFYSSQNLKLMTFNIRYDNPDDGLNVWRNRILNTKNLLEFYTPDIIGFQEVLPNQYLDLKTILPSYNSYSLGRDSENQGEACSLFFNKNRFELLDSGTFWLSPTPNKISKAWGANLNRICSWVMLKDNISKSTLKIYNLHFDHESELSRKNSLALIQEYINKDREQNIYTLVMGDFNTTFSNQELLQQVLPPLAEASTLAKKTLLNNGTFQAFGKKVGQSPRIDYIFVPKDTEVLQYQILSNQFYGQYPSDHFPVLTEIYIPTQN
ncbi:endonuclease/exonuclease/phosphatase family protein [Riemerella anatipestifer]|nr:endonuclease/exonuclease/phosphatase family protein [Riemerella anatipestifer]MCU7582528.1 endonuclease/exonuclease/phosphatase family protein [Riemerella anatipestifer]MCW0485794.1 endonuclease/exonuclease/phosphatase family protein [Riemerella anatipestifer]MDR7750295.1 endonuclease/exonuclease/phosphatase family protein [Riemerella anatipestifer]MDR7764886.1 endonuclease/exonuclease/phosphatase family protein [Riemerella anatipestifer]MDR7777666.1 endonuclease/exonuclease/phosphatase fam